MKKVLLATTALALSAGVASAEVSVSGNARMGLQYINGTAAFAGNMTAGSTGTIAGYNTIVGTSLATTTDIAPSASQISALKSTITGLKSILATKQTDLANAIAATGAPAASGTGSVADVTTAANNVAAAEALLADISGADAVAAVTKIEKRMTVDINGSTETSSGITFGAKLRLRSNEGSNLSPAGARVYMKSGNVEVGMGNINGAIEWMPGLYDASAGLTGLGWGGLVTNTAAKGYWGWDAYSSSGNGAEGIEVMYSAGAFSGHISYSDATISGGASAEKRVAAVGAYTFGDWTVALGMQDSDNNANDKTVLTVGGKVGDIGVGFAAADNDGIRKIALNGSATFGATTVSAYVADEEGATYDTAYGLGVSYDLGGASVVGGISHSEVGRDRADLGVSFSF